MNVKKIETILDNLEKTNKELYQHSERIAMLSYAFAQELNLSYSEREMAYFSGLLHDIGRFYLDVTGDYDFDDDIENIINGSMMYFDDEFSKIIPIISNFENINMEDSDKYDYNINILKIIVKLSNEYDELRIDNISHEKACQFIRKNNAMHNNMVTTMLKAIIKNKLNYEY